MTLRTKASLVGLALCVSTLVGGVSLWAGTVAILLQLQFPVVFGVCWVVLGRLRCPACGAPLSQDFPIGALLALPFSKQACRKCGRPLAP
jgi:hypothetical protein